MPLDMITRSIWRYRGPGGKAPAPSRTFVVAPYAGGSAYSMYDLARMLPDPGEEALVVQYPGRGPRLGEPLAADLTELVECVADELDSCADRLVLVGHSLGGLICYELAHRLERSGREVELLVISAARAPAFTTLRADEVRSRTRQAWIDILRQGGGAVDEVLDEPEMLRIAVLVLRADTMLAAGHRASTTPVRCPMLTIGGDADPDVSATQLRGWKSLTTATATTVMFPGGHFYHRERVAEIASLIRHRLSPARPSTEPLLPTEETAR